MEEDPPRRATDGYPRGTDGYPVGPPTPGAESAPVPNEKDDQPEDGGGNRERSPYWAGFESPEAFFDHIEAERAKIQDRFEAPPRRRHVPTPDFPRGDEIAGSVVAAGGQAAVRQVGVKLRSVDYDLLTEAARLCGVAPSTLARMLVRRGA